MSKSILVIDTPKSCNKCPVYHEGYGHCNVVRSFIKDDTQVDSRCPLIKIPSPDDENWNADFNKYLSELVGEEI